MYLYVVSKKAFITRKIENSHYSVTVKRRNSTKVPTHMLLPFGLIIIISYLCKNFYRKVMSNTLYANYLLAS